MELIFHYRVHMNLLMARQWNLLFKEINLIINSFVLNTYNSSKAHLGCVGEGLMVNPYCKLENLTERENPS